MRDFSEFEKIVRDPEFLNILSKTLSSRGLNIPIPSNAPDTYADELASYVATLSGEVALFLLQTYHKWVSDHKWVSEKETSN